jgi:HlyD family secretion protein
VVITLDDPGVLLRPDLSATADIITSVRDQVTSIPIIALTVREDQDQGQAREEESPQSAGTQETPEGPTAHNQRLREIEGVFVVRDGIAHFTPVEVGITGQEYFEIISGVEPGDTVVAGPYQRIRELKDGDPVKAMETGGAAPPIMGTSEG